VLGGGAGARHAGDRSRDKVRSNLDALFVALAIRRRIRFMGKSELFDGGWGWYSSAGG
jgi:hypothetical protein